MTERELYRLEMLLRSEPPSVDTWPAACALLVKEVRRLQHRLEHAEAAREDALEAYDAIKKKLEGTP